MGIINKLTKGSKTTIKIGKSKTPIRMSTRSHKDQMIRDTAAKVKKTKRAVKQNIRENKSEYIKGGIGTAAGLALGVGAGHQINKYREGKTVKGRIKKAIGR